jgi:hypothetical protein
MKEEQTKIKQSRTFVPPMKVGEGLLPGRPVYVFDITGERLKSYKDYEQFSHSKFFLHWIGTPDRVIWIKRSTTRSQSVIKGKLLITHEKELNVESYSGQNHNPLRLMWRTSYGGVIRQVAEFHQYFTSEGIEFTRLKTDGFGGDTRDAPLAQYRGRKEQSSRNVLTDINEFVRELATKILDVTGSALARGPYIVSMASENEIKQIVERFDCTHYCPNISKEHQKTIIFVESRKI